MRRALLLGALLGAMVANAGEHQLSGYLRGGGQVHLSAGRTMGGIGGGAGVRDVWEDRFLFQADASYLVMIGNVLAVRAGAGVQRRGVYAPAVLLVGSVLFGDQLTFLLPERTAPARGPAFSIGLAIAPLRFNVAETQISMLELGASVGFDPPDLALGFSIGLLEIAASF
ncbi:MAG TPA: hypothetical protein VIG99_07145 [Myxococcaceae bacterium]|jgi:hypothetical protein